MAAPDAADRAARLLALVLDRSPRTLAELADAAGAPEPELEPLVAALERHGLVQWDSGRAQVRHAGPSMRRLADESGETVNLMLPMPGGTEAIAQEDGRHLLGATNWIGRDIPDHASAAGKVFLAHGVARIAPRLERFTDRTLVDHASARGRPGRRPRARLRDARRRA
jgi:IclR family transcriptional regulator, acetate operon repressor